MNRRMRLVRDVAVAAIVGCAVCGISLGSDDLTPEDRETRLQMELTVVVIKAVVTSSGSHPGSGEAVVRLDSVSELSRPPFDGNFKTRDAWGNPFLYLSDPYEFVLFSTGQNGRLDFNYAQKTMSEWEDASGDDLVVSGGGWIKRPLSQRERQKQSMADLRSIATAIEEFSIDNNFYPMATSIEELEPHVSPAYIRALPRVDGWGNPYLVRSSRSMYTLRSLGRDGLQDEDDPVGVTHTFEADLVFEMGVFSQWPEGEQH